MAVSDYRPKDFLETVRDNTARIEELRNRYPWFIDNALIREKLDAFFAAHPRFTDAKFLPVAERITGQLFYVSEWFRTYRPLEWIERLNTFWSNIVQRTQEMVSQAEIIINDLQAWSQTKLNEIASFIDGRRTLLRERIDSVLGSVSGSNTRLNRKLAINAGPLNTGWTDDPALAGKANMSFYPMDLDFRPFDNRTGEVFNPDGLNLSLSGFSRSKVDIDGQTVDRFQFNSGAMVFGRPTMARILDAHYNRDDTFRVNNADKLLASNEYAAEVEFAGERKSNNFCYRYMAPATGYTPTLQNICLLKMKQESFYATRKAGYISTAKTLEDDFNMVLQGAEVEDLPMDLIIERTSPAPDPDAVLESIALDPDVYKSQSNYMFDGSGSLPERPVRE